MSDRDDSKADRGLSINLLLLFSFMLVALMPIVFFGIKVYQAAWDNALREVHEKHQLLAENLAAPISIYVKSQQTHLVLAAEFLTQREISANPVQIKSVLDETLRSATGFRSIFALDGDLKVRSYVGELTLANDTRPLMFSNSRYLSDALTHNERTVSSIVEHPFSGAPAIFITVPAKLGPGPEDVRLLVGELDIQPIEQLRRGIRFGKGGHSAIVDSFGRVIAHPNASWMQKIKDISNLNIVQEMMAGKTGVVEFYSPFKKEQMVAGYTSVPELGWGIMVPQPLEEVADQVRAILYSQFGWGLLGLSLAIVMAHFLGRWITKPIDDLATAGSHLSKQDFRQNLPKPRATAPLEVQQLATAFSDAIHGLSMSRAEVEALNRTLQQRISEATTELRQANTRLSVLARSDHLTKLANRRHFEQTISNITSRRKGDKGDICLLLVDIDHFKDINDMYGHPAGDMVLVQLADILDRNMRQSDLAARYAGDEFVLLIHAGADIGRERAAAILAEIGGQNFSYDGREMKVTVSIGLVSFCLADQQSQFDHILRMVDEAMYEAKRAGRNTVAEVEITPP